MVATGIEFTRWTQHFDTVSVCFSKGLGAPVGSALAGPRELIAQGRRHRKVFGGGMRQAGILAAAALYALDHHVERLADDHANARRFAAGIRQIDGLRLVPEEIDTNMLFFRVDPAWGTAAAFCRRIGQARTVGPGHRAADDPRRDAPGRNGRRRGPGGGHRP